VYGTMSKSHRRGFEAEKRQGGGQVYKRTSADIMSSWGAKKRLLQICLERREKGDQKNQIFISITTGA